MAHRDGYTAFVSSGVGKRLATTLGLPQPVALRRQVPGRPLVDGPVLVGGHGDTPALEALRHGLTAAGATLVGEAPEAGSARRGRRRPHRRRGARPTSSRCGPPSARP